MAYEFTASRVSGDGNALFPDKIIIDDEHVIYRKSRLIGRKDIKLRHEAIGCVTLNKHLLFADIIIETRGGQVITARGFTRSDAETIASIIG
ncbi:MAG: PH domain-containing protein [bacterium]|nr:PH domain-containing protein [bacterium]